MKQAVADHPILILVRGMPGSGKSHLTNELRQAIGKATTVVLDPDAIDLNSQEYLNLSEKLTAEGLDKAIHPYRFLRERAYTGIKEHKIVVWDQALTNQGMFGRMVANLQTYATDHGTVLPTLVVEVEINADIAKRRVAQRKLEGGHGPSDSTLAVRINDYKSFMEDGYRVVSVDGTADIATSVSKVVQALRELE